MLTFTKPPGVRSRLAGLEVRVNEVDKLDISYFIKPGTEWDHEEVDDFFEWSYRQPQNREVILLIAARLPSTPRHEAIQRVLQGLWKQRQKIINGYDPCRGRPMGYFLSVLRCRMLDDMRSSRRRAARETGLSDAETEFNDHSGEAFEQRRLDAKNRLRRCLSLLPKLRPALRAVLEGDLAGWSTKQLSEALKISQETVRKRRQRYRRFFLEALAKGEGAPC